eukprot:CAMPEP_0114690534 /NCGR_PEP_ID=MMETSP0191-20121206/65820_1 /TAXON_ID=126664 /ORGANISM="Sorites sp." /LENGTH=129 /DNA_ID=CAMNT_0001980605 /DNA_START=32 /DNA_END=418 /DNA_ORIENTATION=-
MGSGASSAPAPLRSKPKKSPPNDLDVPGSRQITATLTKRGKYGLRLAKRGSNLWRIIEIQDDGSIAQHNLEHPDASLRVNDLLLKINREDPDITILEKAEEGIEVEVTLLRVPQSIAPPPFSTQAIKPT